MSDFTHEILVCQCGDVRHQLIFTHDEDDNMVYTSVHLTKLSFWLRLKLGLQYIFGFQSKYGPFEEAVLTSAHIPALQKVIETLTAVDARNEAEYNTRMNLVKNVDA